MCVLFVFYFSLWLYIYRISYRTIFQICRVICTMFVCVELSNNYVFFGSFEFSVSVSVLIVV